MPETVPESDTRPAKGISNFRGWFEVVSIFLLMPIGGILGSLTGLLDLDLDTDGFPYCILLALNMGRDLLRRAAANRCISLSPA